MTFIASSSAVLSNLKHEIWSVTDDIGNWVGRLSEGELALGLWALVLFLGFFVIRRPKNHKQSGGIARHLILAVFIFSVFAVGSSLLFDGFSSISRHIG